MATSLRAIYITTDLSLPACLAERVKANFLVSTNNVFKSTRECIQEMIANSYDVCFLSEGYEAGDVQSLIRDIQNLPSAHQSVVVQVVSALDASFDRMSRASSGIGAVITRECGELDQIALVRALQSRIDAERMAALAPEIESATSTMLRELDLAASARKRGREWSLKSLARNILLQQIAATQEIRSMFYDILVKLTGESKSFPEGKLDVPRELLARQPPGLESDSYTGPSRRVWQRLHKRFGRKAPP